MGMVDALCRSWVIAQFLRRAPWPSHQFAAAIGATPRQMAVGTSGAKRAFKRTYACVKRLEWQVAIAAFTVGAKGKHGMSVLLSKET